MTTPKKNPRRSWRPFEEARAFVRSLGLKNKNDWGAWLRNHLRPDDIPTNPNLVYKDTGWNGWGDWFGTGYVASSNRVMRSFEEARAFARELGLQSKSEWNAWTKGNARPSDIPVDPRQVYKESGWIDWGDWLGTNRIATFNMQYRTFQEARIFARSLGLTSQDDWSTWAQSGARPFDIPSTPQGVYKGKGWAGWGDWLGTGRVATFNKARRPFQKVHRPFQEAREFVHGLGLKNQSEWRKWSQTEARPSDIPAYPDGVYKEKGWKSWGDWLGSGRVSGQNMQYLSFQEARAFVRSQRLQSTSKWKEWAKSSARPDSIPSSPAGVYKGKGWVSWGD